MTNDLQDLTLELKSVIMNMNPKGRYFVIMLLVIIIINAGCDKKEKEHGFLKGIITIGPLCPVERNPPDPGCLPTAETYKAYPVSVYSSDGEDTMDQLKPSLDGTYICELPEGKFLVVLDKAQSNMGWSSLPVKVTITAADTTYLNISIDTGIR